MDPPVLYHDHREMFSALWHWAPHMIPVVSDRLKAARLAEALVATRSPASAASASTPPAATPPTINSVRKCNMFLLYYKSYLHLSPTAYAVSVYHTFGVIERPPASGRAAPKAKHKKETIVKPDNYHLDQLSRVELITAMLHAHGLEQQFRPGEISGPPFKIWWTGSP